MFVHIISNKIVADLVNLKYFKLSIFFAHMAVSQNSLLGIGTILF